MPIHVVKCNLSYTKRQCVQLYTKLSLPSWQTKSVLRTEHHKCSSAKKRFTTGPMKMMSSIPLPFTDAQTGNGATGNVPNISPSSNTPLQGYKDPKERQLNCHEYNGFQDKWRYEAG